MGYDYKKLLEGIKDYLSKCERMRYGEMVGAPWPYNHSGPMVYTEPDAILLDQAVAAVAELLARAEAAEARVHELETTHRTEMCEDGYDCAELGKVRRELEAEEARAEKAEKLIDWIYSEAKLSVEYNMRQYLDWLKIKIEEWRGQKEE